VLERILPIPELDFRISADGYLISAAPFYGPVVSIDRPLGGYRQHGKNAWSGDSASRSLDALAEWLRRTLSHDDLKYRIIAEEARRTGKKAHTAPGLRDPGHLTTRLASACLAPEAHPYASDTRLGLGLRGLFHSWSASLPWGRRAVLASWFLAAGILPRALARPATAWMLAPGSRPVGVARALKLARRLLRGGKRPSPRATGGDSSTSTQSS
jgi:hypothetical protein